MYEFKREVQRKNKTFKVYISLFLLSALINLYNFLIDFDMNLISKIRFISALIFYVIIFYLGLKRKPLAEIFIKFIVWINILALLVMMFAFMFT